MAGQVHILSNRAQHEGLLAVTRSRPEARWSASAICDGKGGNDDGAGGADQTLICLPIKVADTSDGHFAARAGG